MPTPIRQLPTRARWTADDARTVLAALDRSGKSVRAFAEEHGLDPQRIYAWRRRVAGGDGITFHEVTVRPAVATEASSGVFEIVLVSGARIRVPPSFDAAALTRLLDVLESTRAC
jgi:transposase-like protein